MSIEKPAPVPEPVCPDCGTPFKLIDPRPGHEAYACPVALEAHARGLLGQPGRKHKAAWIWVRKRAPLLRHGPE